MTAAVGLATHVARSMRKWAELWGLPGLDEGVRVRFSSRLTHSAGRCRPQSGEIVLHLALRHASSQQHAAVLCHEFAHIAAYQLHGRAVQAHGEEWRALVAAAGYAAATRISLATLAPRHRFAPRPNGRLQVVHMCPVCQTTRLARRAVPAWRCAECVRSGLEGRLVITRHSGVEA
jgi:predicted SprT family Zn-dependent metalloprotease